MGSYFSNFLPLILDLTRGDIIDDNLRLAVRLGRTYALFGGGGGCSSFVSCVTRFFFPVKVFAGKFDDLFPLFPWGDFDGMST